MRILEAVSAGLSLTSAAIIFSILATGRNTQLLLLAAICGVIVAVYQIINFYLGYNLQRRIDQSRGDTTTEVYLPAENRLGQMNPADTSQIAQAHSVVDNTTKLLDPVPREGRRDG